MGSARPAALGRQTGEAADPRDQLALGDRTTLLDLNLSLAAVSVVLRTDLVRKVLDDLAVPYQQQVVVDRQGSGDLIEEDSHVLIAVAFAARMLLSGWSSRCACRPGTVEAITWRTVNSGLQRRTVAESAVIQTPVVWRPVIAVPPFLRRR